MRFLCKLAHTFCRQIEELQFLFPVLKMTMIYIIVDLGMENARLLEIELEAACGTIIDIAYGEHLDDL